MSKRRTPALVLGQCASCAVIAGGDSFGSLMGPLQGGEDARHTLLEVLSGSRQAGTARVADEQPNPEVFFQLLDRSRWW